jgi:GNAT superfamily N-acetyltransferase
MDALLSDGWSEFATIDEATMPRSLAEDHNGVLSGMVAVRNAVEVAAYGIPEVAVSAEETLPHYLDEHEPNRVLLARIDGAIVGCSVLERQRDDTEVGWLEVQVLPEFQRRGIGRALSDASERIARELGLTRLITYAVSADAPGERLVAPTGFGAVPAGNREVRFLLARGWTLEQVERGSRLALPADPTALAALRAAAEKHSRDYRVLTWAGATSAELLDDLAILQTRMSTDAPSAGLDITEDIWDADRVREMDAVFGASPRARLTAAAREIATGRLVAITNMDVPVDVDRSANQWATLVLREHRGHRLGLAVKLANLAQLMRDHPGHPSITTINASENEHMLAVNRSMGFTPIAYEASFQRKLAG